MGIQCPSLHTALPTGTPPVDMDHRDLPFRPILFSRSARRSQASAASRRTDGAKYMCKYAVHTCTYISRHPSPLWPLRLIAFTEGGAQTRMVPVPLFPDLFTFIVEAFHTLAIHRPGIAFWTHWRSPIHFRRNIRSLWPYSSVNPLPACGSIKLCS